MVRRPLANAKPENCFWVNNGPVLKNLEELKEALVTMTDEQFRYHVNERKNDFAKWVREVLAEKEIARRLARIKTRKSAFQFLERELELS